MKASIFKRNNSPFYYINWYDKDKKKTGKPVSTKCKDKREAEKFKKRWVALKEEEQKEGLIYEPFTLNELFNYYIQDRKNIGRPLSPGTIISFTRSLTRLEQVIPPDLQVNQYTKQHYTKFVQSMDGISQNTKNIYTKKIFTLFRFAQREKLIKEVPFGVIREQVKELYIMSDKEARLIIQEAKKTLYYNLFRFLFASAFRIHEALKLKKDDIKNGYIYVLGKGNKMAHIPIVKGIRTVFDDMDINKLESEDLLFPFSYDQVRMFLTRLKKREDNPDGLNPLTKIHGTRRYCLSAMANAGISINFVKEFARHSTIATTMKYYIKNDMEKMAEDINKKLDMSTILIDDKIG